MKKIKILLTAVTVVLFSLSTVVSCSENDSSELIKNSTSATGDSKTMARISDENLPSALSEDADFRALSDMIVFFEEMPNKQNFVANFNRETLESQKDDAYFMSLSGYTQQEVTAAKIKLNHHSEQMFSKFPQLYEYNQTDLYNIIERASDLYYNNMNLGSKVKCSTCSKLGRAKMVFYTATGAATCASVAGPFALFAGWACGTAGFAVAGYEALACLEDCQK